MRTLLLLTALVACKPSATVERTMPVANLQSYKTVALRVHASVATNGQDVALENATLDKLRSQCGFQQVLQGQANADVLLDLSITGAGRGGTGFIKNENTATLDTLLVLTDGVSGELLGTAKIHGTSSGMVVNGESPEAEAAGIVAKTVADLLAKSGCSGPRVARVEPPPVQNTTPPPTEGSGSDAGSGSATTPPPAEDHKKEADALNDQGKEKLQTADLAGALANFQGAAALAPDPRYQFNICLVLEAQEQWDGATAACTKAKSQNPNAQLAAKIDARLELIKNHQ